MGWRVAVKQFAKSRPLLSIIGGFAGTLAYVRYKDSARNKRMINQFQMGCVLAPLMENEFEYLYYPRKKEEEMIGRILSSEFCNEYYIVNGEVGVGKTRLIIEMTRHMMQTKGLQRKGAPIYIGVGQGKSFPDTLAASVSFHFDEHISFQFFLDYLMGIAPLPKKDDMSKLMRVLHTIEHVAFKHMLQTGRPVVLIIDGVNNLERQLPGALEKLQDKAKLWSDTNIVKVVFVNNDEETAEQMQRNSSSWSRAANTVHIGDLSHEETMRFLLLERVMERSLEGVENNERVMGKADAEEVMDLVGGRILDLLIFKRDYSKGVPLDVIAEDLMQREREKFFRVSSVPSLWHVVSLLRQAPNKRMQLSKLIKYTNEADVRTLFKHNIISFEREEVGAMVGFTSRLMEVVVEEMEKEYKREKDEVDVRKKKKNGWW